MSFDRVKPGNWAINEKLRSAQMNQLDIDHANAVDKTGDSITGDLNVIGGARIVFAGPSRCVMTSGSVLEVQPGASAVVSSTGFITVQSGGAINIAGTLGSTGSVSFTSGSFTISAGVSTTINSSVSFNGTTFFSQPLTCFNNLIIDGDSVAGNVKLRIKDAAYIDIEQFSKVRILSGATSQALSGSTTEFYGDTHHKSGSVATHDNGSSLVHDDGSAEVYESGSTVEQKSGSNWTCKGGVTISPTGTLFCSFGGTTSFASTPTFFSGYTVTAGTTAIAGTLNVTAAANMSGTTTLSGATNMSGTTTITGASNKLKLTPRTKTKRVPLSSGVAEVVFSDGGAFITGQSPRYVGLTDRLVFQIPAATTDPTQKFNVPLFPMDGWKLVSVTYTRTGNTNLSVSIRRNGTPIGSTPDPTATGTITISPNITINTETESYSVEFVAEKTAVANQTSEVTSLFVTYEISEYSDC